MAILILGMTAGIVYCHACTCFFHEGCSLVILSFDVKVRLLSSHLLPNVLSLLFSQDHIPVPYQPDSSSNPSSTTSSTPSSPAPPLPPSATPPSPLHPSPQCTRQQKPFNLPGTETHLEHELSTQFSAELVAQERYIFMVLN